MSILALQCLRRGHPTWASRIKRSTTGRYLTLVAPGQYSSQNATSLRSQVLASSSRNEESVLDPSKSERDDRDRKKLLHLVGCHGCGAAVQSADPQLPGYFTMSRRAVLKYFQTSPLEDSIREPASALTTIAASCPDHETTTQDVPRPSGTMSPHTPSKDKDMAAKNPKLPLCDRCHQLTHHSSGSSIEFPSLQAVTDSILESPFHNNHVYHIIDAVDFPLSVISDIHRLVPATLQRSRNRRAKHEKLLHGRKIDITFVITRSDLLAPKKEMVDSMMPYFVETLRQALHPTLRNVRLGNVRCVSSKRGWWTKILKDDVRDRTGGCWLVGKVNVGKSSLFEAIFPKGSHIVKSNPEQIPNASNFQPPYDALGPGEQYLLQESKTNSTASHLLPPARTETRFPEMPIVSSFPGTTASPIRIPFGNGRGELIDLPGLSRSNLDKFVKPEHRHRLIMKTRIQPKQYVLKPGQSLLLGGLFRITAADPDLTLLAYPFVPLEAHVTSTEKASEFLSAAESRNIPSIAIADIGNVMARAGAFSLQWDVTQQRAGPLLSRTATKMKAHNLPFKVMSADIVIAGCGWVELVCQVRRRESAERTSILTELREPSSSIDLDASAMPIKNHPIVEVFSPEGLHVGVRRPLGAWLLNDKPSASPAQKRNRPRRSIRSTKGNPKRYADIPNQSKLDPP